MRYLVHGVGRENVDEQTDLEEVAERPEDSFRLTAPRASSPRSTAVGREGL